MKFTEMLPWQKDKNFLPKLYRSRRMIIVLLMILGYYSSTSMRSHIGVGMVCMVNNTAIKHLALLQESIHVINPSYEAIGLNSPFDEQKCRNGRNDTKDISNDYKGTLIWTTDEQSVIFSASFYGNAFIMFFSGFLVDRFGPFKIGLISMIGMVILSFLTPLFATINYQLFVILRIIFGIFENPLLPSIADMVVRWFPIHERSTVAAFYTSGNQLSASIGVIIGTKFCEFNFLNGWPLIFYMASLLGLLWIIGWSLLATDFPSQNKFLKDDEKVYLYDQSEKHFATFHHRRQSGVKMPLKNMLCSTATWAVILAHFSVSFSNTMMTTYLPTYIRDVMNLGLNDNGFYTAMPIFVQLFSKNLLGNIADLLKRKGKMTQSASCKLFQSIASFGGAFVCIVFAVYVDCTTPTAALIFLAIFGFCFGGHIPGNFTASLSIAPSFTGMIASFTNIATVIGNILAPVTVGILVQQGNRFEWSIVFSFVAVINIIGGIVFLIYGTAKVQPWAKVQILSVATLTSDHCGDDQNRNNAIRHHARVTKHKF